jgi:hypothetical protein
MSVTKAENTLILGIRIRYMNDYEIWHTGKTAVNDSTGALIDLATPYLKKENRGYRIYTQKGGNQNESDKIIYHDHLHCDVVEFNSNLCALVGG